jgi:hypothetical protein
MKSIARFVSTLALAVVFSAGATLASDRGPHATNKFQGPKANTGTALHLVANGKSMLKVSDDFKVPDTPAPTWRVVDTKGNIYTLDAFKIKGGEKREIEVPAYIPNIAKVQVYCAWAQVLLGEASFPTAVQ